MSNKTNGSRQLLALSFGLSCCFFGLPALAEPFSQEIAQVSDAQSSAERIAEITARNDRNRLGSANTDCSAALAYTYSDIAFARSVLSIAEASAQRIEDMSDQVSAFPKIAKSYACIGEGELARDWLARSLLLEHEQPDESTSPTFFGLDRPRRLLEMAKIYANMLNDAQQAQALLTDAVTELSQFYGSNQNLQLEIAELYGDIGNIEQMNAIISEVVASVEIDTDAGDSYIYPSLGTAARLHAKFGQYQQLRQLLDSVDVAHVREDMVAEASSSLLQVESSADRAVIAELFPEFNTAALVADYSGLLNPRTPSDPIYDYRYQLREVGIERLAEVSDDNLETFVDEQKEVIRQSFEPLMRAVAYKELGKFLSYYGQPERALLLFEESLQMFGEYANRASLAAVGRWEITERSHRRSVQGGILEALVRADRYEQAYQLLQKMEAEYDEISLERLVRFRARFADVVESPTFSLSDEVRFSLLAEAVSLAPQIEDKQARLETLIDIADEYIGLEEMALARQLAPAIEAAYDAAIAEVKPGDYSRIPESYAEFLISVGDYERAIALTEERKEDVYFTRALPAQFVEAGEAAIAHELRKSFDLSVDRLLAGRDMVLQYQVMGKAEEALELTKRLLEEAQSVDLAAEEAAGVRGIWHSPVFDVDVERIDRVAEALNAYRPGYSSFHSDTLSPEAVSEIGIALAKTIESDWLRYSVVIDELPAEDAIALLETDPVLPVSDGVLMRRVLELVRDENFQEAVSVAQRMRSPYLQVRSLTHIATQSLSE